MCCSDLCTARQLAMGSDIIATPPMMPTHVCDVCSHVAKTSGQMKCHGGPRILCFKAAIGALAVTCALGTAVIRSNRSTWGVGAPTPVSAPSRVVRVIIWAGSASSPLVGMPTSVWSATARQPLEQRGVDTPRLSGRRLRVVRPLATRTSRTQATYKHRPLEFKKHRPLAIKALVAI